MQIEERLNLSKLFDTYGKLLSQRQYEVFDKYLNCDLGESELAEMSGETRQSIHDAISKAKKQLFVFEEKCKIVVNNEKLLDKLRKIRHNLEDNDLKSSIEAIDKIIDEI